MTCDNSKQRVKQWVMCVTNLFQGAFHRTHFDDHPEGNTEHGGQGQEPAQAVAPPRVHILIVVLQRGVLDQGEGKGTLQRQINAIICVSVTVTGCYVLG